MSRLIRLVSIRVLLPRVGSGHDAVQTPEFMDSRLCIRQLFSMHLTGFPGEARTRLQPVSYPLGTAPLLCWNKAERMFRGFRIAG